MSGECYITYSLSYVVLPDAGRAASFGLPGGRQVDQVLVRWSGCDNTLDTWEDELSLWQQFPSAAAWGQAAPQGGGNVSSRGSYKVARKVRHQQVKENEKLHGESVIGHRVPKPNTRYPSDIWSM